MDKLPFEEVKRQMYAHSMQGNYLFVCSFGPAGREKDT